MGKVCKKCGYERLLTDAAPDYECPKCGAIYAKVEAAMKRKVEEDRRKKAEEEERRQEMQREKEEEEKRRHRKTQLKKEAEKAQERIITKTYTGNQEKATMLFQADAAKMAGWGYYPTSQTWAPGQYGCGAFLLALVLCFVFVGLLIFLYMLIVKPPGKLSVTYELQDQKDESETKVCPRCAETVKSAAIVCRYYGHEFKESVEL